MINHPLAAVILDAAESAFEWAHEHERAPPGHYQPAGALKEIGRYLTRALDYHAQRPADAPAWTPEEIADLAARLDAKCNLIQDATTRREYKMFIARKLAALRGMPPEGPEYPFEAWLIERYLRWVRSEAFEASAEREYLLAEWERGR